MSPLLEEFLDSNEMEIIVELSTQVYYNTFDMLLKLSGYVVSLFDIRNSVL